jgi:RND family efflux transporter MFP subunit
VAEAGTHPILNSKAFWPIALASAAGISALAYALWTQSSAGRLVVEREVKVEVVAAKKITMPAVAEAVGQLQASKEMTAVSPVPGVLKEMRVKVGDVVKRGEVVAVLQAQEWLGRANANEAAVKAAAAQLNETKAQLENAEQKLATTRELYRRDLIARRDVEEMETLADTARAEKERAQAELAQREAALAQTRYLLSLTKITAPAGGIVTRRVAEPGASVPASAVLMSIADPAMMRVAITVGQSEARLMRAGMSAEVRVSALPERIYRGTVSNVKMVMDGDGATAQIDVANADGLLKPGLEASVSVALGGTRELTVVPRAAVFELAGKPSVYVIDGRRAQTRNVTTAGEISEQTVIASNLAEGEKVIVAADENLQPGSYVRVVEPSRANRSR